MANAIMASNVLLEMLFLMLINKTLSPCAATYSLPGGSPYAPSVVSDCHPVLNITCFSSCSFTSQCWGMKEEASRYITCSWEALETHLPLKYHAIIQDTGVNFCLPTVSCEESSVDGTTLVLCSTVVFANDTKCSFITNGDNTIFSVEVFSGEEKLCMSLARFNPCDIVKLNPPYIEEISSEDGLEINVRPPQCAEKSWTNYKFALRYSTFNGISSAPDKYLLQPPFKLPLFDAMEYRLSTYVAIEQVAEVLRVWSDPQDDLIVTAPIVATDNDFIFQQCLQYGSKSTVIATWQKTGVVSGFQCRLVDMGDETLLAEEYVAREFQLQTVFQIQFDNLNEDRLYRLSVVADNSKGVSQPTNATIAKRFCDNSEKNPRSCQRFSNDLHWMVIGWLPPTTTLAYNKLKIFTFSNVVNLTSDFVPSQTTKYNLTNLESCVLYTIVVESYYDAIKVGHCTFQAFTKEVAPKGAPRFDLIKTSESTITIHIGDMPPSLSCSSLISYEIKYTINNGSSIVSSPTNEVVVADLQPFSDYTVQVAAINQAGRGPLSLAVLMTTGQAAPSSPPVVRLDYLDDNLCVIAWKQPDHPNGLISHYVMYVVPTSDSTLESATDQCAMEEETMKCLFQSNQYNITMRLSSGSTVQMQACTDEGKKCSTISPSVKVNPPDPFPMVLTIILSCILLVLVALAFCYFHLIRSRGFQVKGPHINSKILLEISQTTTSKKDDIISSTLVNDNGLAPCSDELCDSVQVWRSQSANGSIDQKAKISRDKADHWDIPISDTSDYLTERQSSVSDDEIENVTRKNSDRCQSIDEDYVSFGTGRTLPGEPCSNSMPFHPLTDNVVISSTFGNMRPRQLSDIYPHEVYFSEKSTDSGVSSLLRHDSDDPASPTHKHFFPTDIDVTAHARGSPTGQKLLRSDSVRDKFIFGNESVI